MRMNEGRLRTRGLQGFDRYRGREIQPGAEVQTDAQIDQFVRQKVESDPAAPVLIHSVRGFGYTFEPRRAMAAV